MAVLAVLRTVILGYYKTPLYLARDNICLDLPVKEPWLMDHLHWISKTTGCPNSSVNRNVFLRYLLHHQWWEFEYHNEHVSLAEKSKRQLVIKRSAPGLKIATTCDHSYRNYWLSLCLSLLPQLEIPILQTTGSPINALEMVLEYDTHRSVWANCHTGEKPKSVSTIWNADVKLSVSTTTGSDEKLRTVSLITANFNNLPGSRLFFPRQAEWWSDSEQHRKWGEHHQTRRSDPDHYPWP